MSNDGSPPDPPRPGPGPEGAGEGGPDPQQTPYNPYPQSWDQPGQASPPPAPAYGEPPPYGQQNPYGAPAAPYGQAPGQPGAPVNPYAGAPRPDRPVFGFGGYAGWFTRVGAYLIDQILGAVAGIPLWIGYVIILANTDTTTNVDGTTTTSYQGSIGFPLALVVVGGLTSLAFFIWNVCIRQGRTGATIGKSVLAIRLVNSDLQPIGGGWAFLRYLLHIVDGLPCYLGYLWPIWDSRKQTFADKIMNSFVIHATEPQQQPS
jgi:uncharacterized RDD family membrane protein YckC